MCKVHKHRSSISNQNYKKLDLAKFNLSAHVTRNSIDLFFRLEKAKFFNWNYNNLWIINICI